MFFYIYLGRYYFVIFADINLFFQIMIAYRFQHMFSLLIYFYHQDITEILWGVGFVWSDIHLVRYCFAIVVDILIVRSDYDIEPAV